MAAAALPAKQTSKMIVSYKVAPLSICRAAGKNHAALVFHVGGEDGESGVLVLAYPKWFKRHTWKLKHTVFDDKGQWLRTTSTPRNFWSYVDMVMLDRVAKMLREKGYGDVELKILNRP